MHVDFNPRPPRPPVNLPPGATTKSTDLPPGIVGYSIQDRFLRFYNRPNCRSSDAVELDGQYLDMLRADSNFPPTENVIVGRLHNRARGLINRLHCDESASFTDGGYELMPTRPYSDMSWAIGRYSLYWRAHGEVGPRRCNVPVANCDGNLGSTAAYSFTVEWTVYDVFDFDWRIVFMVPFWFGCPFHVFGIWTTTHQGMATTCASPPPTPPPCQEPLTISTYYDVLTGVYSSGAEKPAINISGAIDSAMGRLLQDGKEWCDTGRCTEGTCQPRFSKVTARIRESREEVGANEITRRYTRVEVHATISCTCGGPLDIPFPHPG